MQTISLKMEPTLLEEIDANLEKNRYSTRTEFIRDAIRLRLEEFEKKERLEKLSKLKGSLKGKLKSVSNTELDMLAKEFIKEKFS